MVVVPMGNSAEIQLYLQTGWGPAINPTAPELTVASKWRRRPGVVFERRTPKAAGETPAPPNARVAQVLSFKEGVARRSIAEMLAARLVSALQRVNLGYESARLQRFIEWAVRTIIVSAARGRPHLHARLVAVEFRLSTDSFSHQ